MRIFKDLPYCHLEDKFQNKNSPIGIIIDKLKRAMPKDNEFLELLCSINIWGYQKISLWAFEEILNHIDHLLEKYSDNEDYIIIQLKFLHLLLTNSNQKDIFSSFDNLQKIFRTTYSLKIKILIVDIYGLFTEVKKSIMEINIEFIDSCAFLVPTRQIIVDFIIGIKNIFSENNPNLIQNLLREKINLFYEDSEKLLLRLFKDESKMTGDKKIKIEEIKNLFRKISQHKNNDEKLIILENTKNILESSFGKTHEEIIFIETILNLFNLCSYLKLSYERNLFDEINRTLITITKFTLNTLNLLIAVSQKKIKVPIVSEYYIEKYLKDVLEVITSGFSLELKSVFLLSTIGFVTYFDGYENILFQNGLFHSILSDLTAPKFNKNIAELEVLTFEQTLNQDFLNAVLVFIYRTSSFKEIPVHFLNKVLELPKDNVYPYRLDNVILSLKKKRTFEDNILDELVIPRLIYELNNFWIDESKLFYLQNLNKSEISIGVNESNIKSYNESIVNLQNTEQLDGSEKPTIFERSNLIQKLFKILYVIFETNTTSSSVRYYEGKIIDAVSLYIKTFTAKLSELDPLKVSYYEPLMVACIDLIVRVCDILPSKIPSMIQNSSIPNIFAYLTYRIPSQSNIINLIFFLFSTMSKNEEGAKFLNENQMGEKVITKIFDVVQSKEEFCFSNVFTPNGFISEEFYNPYNAFLNMENLVNKPIIKYFFEIVGKTVENLKIKVDKILKDEDEDIKLKDIIINKTINNDINTMRFSHTLHLIGQFFINITPEEKEALTTDNLVNFKELIINFYKLILHPVSLFSLNSTVVSSKMIKGTFNTDPLELLNHLDELVNYNIKVLGLDLENQESVFFFNKNQKNRILSKLVHLCEFTIRKLLHFLKEKENFINKILVKLYIIMKFLVKEQSTINLYLSPINDSVLLINHKNYYKFLSSKLNPNLRRILINKARLMYNVKVFGEESDKVSSNMINLTIFNEEQCINMIFQQSLENNMKIEIIDENNPFTHELIDSESKIILNSQMPILEFLVTLGKSIRNSKKLNSNDIETIKCWSSIAYTLNNLIMSFQLDKYLNLAREVFLQKNKNKLEDLINNIIYFINTLNNVNIVLGDKIISPYITYQFVKFGGVESLFDISEFLINFSELINTNECPLLIFLLIKNLWNILTSIIMRIVKFNIEGANNAGIILQKEGIATAFDASSIVKLHVLMNVQLRFLDGKSGNLKKIQLTSYAFHSMIYSILDICINQYKQIEVKKDEELNEKLIEEVTNMGFNRKEIIHAMGIGKKTVEEIINYLIANEQVADEEMAASNNENEMAEADVEAEVNITDEDQRKNNKTEILEKPEFDKESLKILFEEFEKFSIPFNLRNLEGNQNKAISPTVIKESYSSIFNILYKTLLEDEINTIKISQTRKLSILFRLKETLNYSAALNNKLLIPFLREIFVMERENFIEVQTSDSNINLKRLLQNRQLINYIITKDRASSSNIFENLDIDEIADFFEEFNVIENSFLSIKSILNSIDKFETKPDEMYLKILRELIYESLFIINIGFLFYSYFVRVKKEKESDLDLTKFNANRYKKDFFAIFDDMISIQLKTFKLNEGSAFLDEQNLIIIFSIVSENFEHDEVFEDFIEKGGFKNILKLRKTQITHYENLNDSRFKFKVVFDETFRMFIFKLFEDSVTQEALFESIFKYIVANLHNQKNENTSYAETFKANKKKKLKTEVVEFNLNNIESNVIEPPKNDIVKPNEIVVNFDDFITASYSLVPIDINLYINVIKKIFVTDKKIEKQIKSVGKKKKNQPNSSSETTQVSLVMKVLPEHYTNILQISNDIKNSQIKDKETFNDEYNLNSNEKFSNQKQVNNINSTIVNNVNNINSTPTKSKKQIETQILKINKQISNNKSRIVNSLIKHIWDITTELEKEIEKQLAPVLNKPPQVENDKKNHHNPKDPSQIQPINIQTKNIIDLDTALITLANLIHTYPFLLSVVLKFHHKGNTNLQSNHKKSKEFQKEDSQPTKTGFFNFLFKKVFYVMQFFKNCVMPNFSNISYESLVREKVDVIRTLHYEPNSHFSSLESIRSHNIISYLMQAICYKKRNMSNNDYYLVNKTRKKIFKEIDSLLYEIKPKEESSSVRNLLLLKLSVFSLYSLTELHDSSHVYHQTNPFEISRCLVNTTKESNEIVKNIAEMMKKLNLSTNLNFTVHKYSTIFLSELVKFIRINPKIELKNTILSKEDYSPKNKFVFSGDANLLLDYLDDGNVANNANNMNIDQNLVSNIIEEVLQEEDNEENEEADDEEGEDFMDEEGEFNDDNSENDFFFSNSSEDEENQDEESLNNEEIDNDESEDEEERPVIEINMENLNEGIMNEDEFNEEDDEDDEDNFFDEDEDEGMVNQFDANHNEVSVQFNDDVNEYLNLEREDESNFDDEESDIVNEGLIRSRGALLHGHNNNRRVNLNSILLNNNDNFNFQQESHDDLLFLNNSFDRTNKFDTYHEDNIIFPFNFLYIYDDIYEFYRPGLYVSIFSKITRTQMESMNMAFCYKFVSPFDRKSKRNLIFALNRARERMLLDYGKEITKLESNFLKLCSEDLFKNYVTEIDSIENIKNHISKKLGFDLKEIQKENETAQVKQSETNNNMSIKKNKSNGKSEIIESEILENIPEDLQQGVIQKTKKLLDNSNISEYNAEDIDPELLGEVSDDILPNNMMQINQSEPNACENANSNSNQPSQYDAYEFINSLPMDLREEILITSSPNFIRSLPEEMQQEAFRLRSLSFGGLPLLDEHIHIEAPPEIQNLFNPLQNAISQLALPVKEKRLSLKAPKYTFEEILTQQKHQKEQTGFIVNIFDEEFIENLISFNIKQTSEPSAKTKINLNPYWVLINSLMQNSNLRFKILDVLIIIWILDSICLKKLIKDNPDLQEKLSNEKTQNSLLNYVYQLYIENKVLEEFFYDDYDHFIRNFCDNFPKEMKKFFLETVYTEKGEYISSNGKKYYISKHITAVKDLLQINYQKEENVLSNLIRIMLINSKSDIKKIFALKIFTKIVTKCLFTVKSDINNSIKEKSLKISINTIEMIVNLFYNFETILKISKDKKSNNPTTLLCEMVADHKCFELLLTVLINHIQKLNEGVSYEMDNFFIQKKIDINEFSSPLPENVLFKIIKLVNGMNAVINKDSKDKKNNLSGEEDESENIDNMDEDNPEENHEENQEANQEEIQPLVNENNQMIIDDEAFKNETNKNVSIQAKEKSDKIKTELNEFIKKINSMLLKCWEKLDMLLFEVSKMMKEDQKIIDPKLNRLIPYLEAFITLSHLQFLPDNKNENFNNQFIMEAAYKRTPVKTPQKAFTSDNKDQLDIHFNDFFFKFSDKNKKVINLILRRYPKMFPPEILIKISHILDIENKKKYFKYELRKLKANRDYHTNLRIKRERIFMDSYHQLRNKKPEDIRGKLTVTFVGEEMAVDAGGVKREWFTLLSREMFNPNFMLFKLAANGLTYMPNSESGMFESDHLQLFSFIGRTIAKAIYDNYMLDCYFTRSFYKLLCNTPLTYHDMEDYDPVFYKNLKWLLETDISDMGELYTYSYEEDRFGKLEVVDLIPNGRNISVTEDNKFEYVQKLCYAKLFETIKPQMEALQKGFYEIIPLKLITIFDHRELELVISGLPTIDINDLKENTTYENYTVDSQIIKWFWEILESYDNDERCEFIQFVTGSSKVPLEGFSMLQGIGGINKFKISKVFDKNFDRLPSAHTCTNQLDLPDYPSREILQERLGLAIREGKVGFGFV